MIRLAKAAEAWGNDDFGNILKAEIEQLDAAQLPLQAGLSQSSYVSGDSFQAMIISTNATADHIRARAGIFYAGIIAGCNCSDDPSPVDTQTEHCEVLLDINRATGETTVTLIRD